MFHYPTTIFLLKHNVFLPASHEGITRPPPPQGSGLFIKIKQFFLIIKYVLNVEN